MFDKLFDKLDLVSTTLELSPNEGKKEDVVVVVVVVVELALPLFKGDLRSSDGT